MNYRKETIDSYIRHLSSPKPVPGGGSAAALVGTAGIALSLMVARIMLPKGSPTERTRWKAIIHDLNVFKRSVQKVVNQDPRQYEKVIRAYSLAKERKDRRVRVEKALIGSYESMRDLAVDLCGIQRLNNEIGNGASGAVANDLRVSNEFVSAAFYAAAETASINVKYICDAKTVRRLTKEIDTIKSLYAKVKGNA